MPKRLGKDEVQMSLETRVETLEHELKILKNEIESTLLEIQNQVLIHYYPSLRAEELTPPKELLTLRERSTQAGPQPKESADPPLLRDNQKPLVKTKELSLSAIKGKADVGSLPAKGEPPRTKTQITPLKQQVTALPAAARNQAALPYIAKWVNESVAKIGKELTQNMVTSSASADDVAPAITDLLLQFVTLCDEAYPPEQVDTNELMDVLLKLNKMVDQVAKLTELSAPVKKEKKAVAGAEVKEEEEEEVEEEVEESG
jgi:hypothetical protein